MAEQEKKYYWVKQDIIFPVWHGLYNPDIMPFKEILIQL